MLLINEFNKVCDFFNVINDEYTLKSKIVSKTCFALIGYYLVFTYSIYLAYYYVVGTKSVWFKISITIMYILKNAMN